MKIFAMSILIFLGLPGILFAQGAGGQLYLEQVEISQQTCQLGCNALPGLTYDLYLVNTSTEVPIYLSKYWFASYGAEANPGSPPVIIWTAIPPGGTLDLKMLSEPLYSACAKGRRAVLGITMRVHQ
jgi:hypothetical protein